MTLKRIDIHGVRNIQAQSVEFGPGINLMWGKNGSGKTSILEAINILATGKSFRTNQVQTVISKGEHELLVSAEIENTEGECLRLGIRRGRKDFEARIKGQRAKTLAELAKHLPVVVVTPESHRLLEAGPNWRRRYLDWGLFHVEQDYAEKWSRFNQVLKQRNAALQQGLETPVTSSWTQQLSSLAVDIDQARKSYFVSLLPTILAYVNEFLPEHSLEFEYYQGWPNRSYDEALQGSWERDIAYGRTEYGPHKADLRIKFNGLQARDTVSRGQQKLLVYALELAQVEFLYSQTGKRSVLLLDDLGAELDSEKISRLLQKLTKDFHQILVTSALQTQISLSSFEGVEMFHVEQGKIVSN